MSKRIQNWSLGRLASEMQYGTVKVIKLRFEGHVRGLYIMRPNLLFERWVWATPTPCSCVEYSLRVAKNVSGCACRPTFLFHHIGRRSRINTRETACVHRVNAVNAIRKCLLAPCLGSHARRASIRISRVTGEYCAEPSLKLALRPSTPVTRIYDNVRVSSSLGTFACEGVL